MRKVLKLLEAINVKAFAELFDLSTKLKGEVLAQIVLHHIHVGELGSTLSEDCVVEKVSETVVVDEVVTNTEGLQVRLGILSDTVSDCLNTLLSKAIVTEIDKLKSRIYLQQFAQSASTVDINLITVQIQVLKSLVLFESLSNCECSRDTEFALAEVKNFESIIALEGGSESLCALLQDLITAEVQNSDLRFAKRILMERVGQKLNVILGDVANTEVEHLESSSSEHLHLEGPLGLFALRELLVLEIVAIEARISYVEEFKAVFELLLKLILGHFFGDFLITVPDFLVVVGDLEGVKEQTEVSIVLEGISKREVPQVTLLFLVHCTSLGKKCQRVEVGVGHVVEV